MRPVLLGSLLPLLLACGSNASSSPPKTAVTVPAGPMQVAAPAPDLSPVATPTELVALGRLARPSSLVSTFAGWVSLPFEPKMLDALEPGLVEALAVDSPVEFAVVLPSGGMTEAKPQAVVSIGLANTDKAKVLLENYNGSKLKEQAPGVWLSAEESKAKCAVAASLGKTTSRLVCSADIKSLTELLPYATRGLPLENLGAAEFRAEIRVAPLQRKFAAAARMGKTMGVPALLKLVALDDPRFDRPFADAAHALGDELIDWFEDLDRVAVELSVPTKPEQVEARVSVVYKSRKSLLATAAGAVKGRMSSPGPMFFDLPAEVTSAEYYAAADAKLLERPKLLTNALIDGFLSHLDVGAELRRSVAKAIDGLLSQNNTVVVGHAAVSLPTGKAPTENEQLASLVGCHVIGIDGSATPYVEALKAFTKLDNDKAFKKGIDRIFTEKMALAEDADSSNKPAKPKPKAAPSKSVSSLLAIKSKSVKNLPAGSEVATIVFETKAAEELISDTQKKLNRRGKVPKLDVQKATILLAVVPDGNRAWVIVSADEKTLVEHAKGIIAGGTTARLSTRTELGGLRGASAYRAGFMTLLDLKSYLGLVLTAKGKSSKETETTFSTLPHHGSTPIFYKYVAAGDTEHPTLEGTITIPRAVFDDVAAAVPSLMMSF